jgi:hypothetical protein
MPRPYAWLDILHILKATACTNTDKDGQRQRRLDMFHRIQSSLRSMACALRKTARNYRWADKLVRVGCAFWHIISMDGLEIAATALSSAAEQ